VKLIWAILCAINFGLSENLVASKIAILGLFMIMALYGKVLEIQSANKAM